MDPDLTIVLLGKAGAGKSASGNTILGRPAFESRLSFKPVTKEICEKTGRVFGKNISVIDTPGILDTEGQIKTCQNLLQSNRRVLFLVLIRVGRFTKEEQEAVEAAIRVLGPQGLKKSYLLFTGGDMLKKMTLTDFIFEENEGSLPDVVKKFSGAYHLFNNEDGDEEQVRTLLLKSGYLNPHVLVDPLQQKEKRIVLIGRPGGGKSSSGNIILGSERFRSDCDFDSVSTETVSESAEVEGHKITVVDTPGFTDEVLTPEQLYLEIMKTLIEASPGPHAFVIVVRLGRISEADKKLFEIIPTLFGSEASKYIMVLFTNGDQLGGQSIDDKINSNSSVFDLVSMCAGRFCVFENSKRGNRQQVREFLRKIDEMVEANGGKHYTSEMFKMAETFSREERNLSEVKKTCQRRKNPAIEERISSDQPTESDPSGEREEQNLSGEQSAWEKISRFLLENPKLSMFLAVVALAMTGAGIGAGIGAAVYGAAGAAVGAAAGAAAGAAGGAAAGAAARAAAGAAAGAARGAAAFAAGGAVGGAARGAAGGAAAFAAGGAAGGAAAFAVADAARGVVAVGVTREFLKKEKEKTS